MRMVSLSFFWKCLSSTCWDPRNVFIRPCWGRVSVLFDLRHKTVFHKLTTEESNFSSTRFKPSLRFIFTSLVCLVKIMWLCAHCAVLKANNAEKQRPLFLKERCIECHFLLRNGRSLVVLKINGIVRSWTVCKHSECWEWLWTNQSLA